MYRPWVGILVLILCSAGIWAQEIRVGVLAKRGIAKTHEKWDATAAYLNRELPSHRFSIVALDFDEIHTNVEQKKIDFIIANSAYYVDLEYHYGVGRIATLQNRHISGRSYKQFAGVVFTRAKRQTVQTYPDLIGRTFAAVDPQSFGGWHMAWRELKQAGIEPEDDFDEVIFSGTHDRVVYDVLEGRADAGTVRSDTLERMELEGKITLADLRIIAPKDHEGFEFVHSTPLYAEWPIAKLHHVSDRLAKEVAIALMRMDSEEPAALNSRVTGWSIPSNYQNVHDALKVLKIGPYEHLGQITFEALMEQYGFYLLSMFILLVGAITATVVIGRLNRNLATTARLLEVENRNKEIARRELVAANEKLMELDRMKSMFIASMSHEFRTPLNSIIGFTGVLLQNMTGTLNEKQSDFLNRIQNSGKHLLGLITDVIDISKIEAGRLEVVYSTFDLREAVNEAVEEIGILARKKGLDVYQEIPEGIELYSDRRRFMQALLNYLSNGVKFSEVGSVTVTAVPHEDTLALTVADTGIGITHQDIDKLFQPFVRLESPLQVQAGGTGLGLYLTKKIVEEILGGSIYVESEPGRGSRFGFKIPLQVKQKEA